MNKPLPLFLKIFVLMIVMLIFVQANAQKRCTWSGSVNSEYYNPANWKDNYPLPAETKDIIVVPADCVIFPEFPVPVKCREMIIESTEKMSPAGSPFGISGEFTVDGNFTIKLSASVVVYSDGWFTVNGNLAILGTMVLESGSSLITNGSVTGNATIKRDIPDDLSWHLVSSPVNQQNICNGVFAPTTAAFPGTNWDFYKWLPNCPTPPLPAERWRNLRTATGGVNYTDFGTPPAFEVTKGYLVAYGSGFNVNKVFYGIPNTGDKTCNFSDIASECSWELAGNPFPSSIDWYQVTDKENLITDYFYIWNEAKAGGAGYECFKDSLHFSDSAINQYIHPQQGFFVKVDPYGGKTIGLPNSARVHDEDLWLKSSVQQLKKLTVKLSNGVNFDEAVIMFENDGNIGKDRNDAEKLFSLNNVPQVYTIVDNDLKACVNSMSFTNDGATVPIGILAPADGNYSMTVRGIESFSSLSGLFLEDLKLNVTQNLLQNPVYNFTAAGIEDAGRFLLHFTGTISISEKSDNMINIYANEKSVFINSGSGLHNAHVTITNLLGQEILTRKLNDQTINQIRLNNPQGYYIVKVQDDSSVKTAKVYLN